MDASRINRTLFVALLGCLLFVVSPRTSIGQSEVRTTQDAERPMDVDVEVQLHLLVGSNAGESGKLPAMFSGIARELSTALPFSNYRLGASYLSRVKNGRPMNVRGVGRSLLVAPASGSWDLPPFYEMSASMLNLKPDAAGHTAVQVVGFRFGLRIPLQTGLGQTKEGGGSTPQIQYEPIGITTDVTIREGEAVVVGTLDAGRPNESLVLVLVARRASARQTQ